jgi:hypothetical protein
MSEIKGLQSQLRTIASKMGWSINELARNIYTELNDIDNENEIRKFEQNFIKVLSRSTTKKEKRYRSRLRPIGNGFVE